MENLQEVQHGPNWKVNNSMIFREAGDCNKCGPFRAKPSKGNMEHQALVTSNWLVPDQEI